MEESLHHILGYTTYELVQDFATIHRITKIGTQAMAKKNSLVRFLFA